MDDRERSRRVSAGKALLCALLIALGAAAGFVLERAATGTRGNTSPPEVRTGMHHLVNPLLECLDVEPLAQVRTGIKELLTPLVEHEKAAGNVAEISVYYRDLSNGPWVGINEKAEFAPASLMKVPLLMGYLRQAAGDPALLAQSLVFRGPNEQLAPHAIPAERLAPGSSYSVQDLLHRMVTHADEDAAAVLFAAGGDAYFRQVMSDLRLPVPDGGRSWSDYRIRVKDYAALFRILYNASYLDPETSSKSLALLSRVDYRAGLPAGLPPDVSVAHMFGERGGNGEGQFHDCGIVYYRPAPYLLCVMTRGKDREHLVSTVAAISDVTFQRVKALAEEQLLNWK